MTAPVLALLSLLAVAATEAAPPAPGPVKNVIVVTMDGLRPEEFFGGADDTLLNAEGGGVREVEPLKTRYAQGDPEARRHILLPFLWEKMAAEGQIFGDRSANSPATVSNGMNFSYPGYNEMFCGYGDPRINSNNKTPNPNISVFEFLNNKADFHGRVAAFCTWDVFPSILRSTQNGLPVHAGWTPVQDDPLSDRQKHLNLLIERLPHYWPGNAFDVVPMEAGMEHLTRHKPRVLFIGLGETDEWAHGRRYDLYLNAAHASDRFLAALWDQLQQMPEYRDSTALLVTTDHGRGVTPRDWTSHGGNIPGAQNIWIALMGPGIPPLGVRRDVAVTQSQVAATIATLLGENFQTAQPKAAPPLPLQDNPSPSANP